MRPCDRGRRRCTSRDRVVTNVSTFGPQLQQPKKKFAQRPSWPTTVAPSSFRSSTAVTRRPGGATLPGFGARRSIPV
jgi:hypothetical protein